MQRLCWHKIDMAIWCGWSILSFHHKPPRDGRSFAVRHAKQIEAGGQAFQVDFVCVLVYFHGLPQHVANLKLGHFHAADADEAVGGIGINVHQNRLLVLFFHLGNVKVTQNRQIVPPKAVVRAPCIEHLSRFLGKASNHSRLL